MKIFLLLAILLGSQNSKAQVLLVPSADRNFEIYRERCQKEGYLCTTNYLLENLQKQPTPQFDMLLEDLDYSSKEFCSELTKRSLNILKSEMISAEQAEILIKLLSQAKSFVNPQSLKALQAIENQLQEDLDLVQKIKLTDLPAEFAVVFKKPVPANSTAKFQSGFLKEKIEKIKFTRTLFAQENLIAGSCENETIHPSIQDAKWQIDRENSCGFTRQIASLSRSSSSFIKENKNILLIGSVVAIGAVLLLNKYEVEVSF